MASEAYDCQACGTCCIDLFGGVSYVRLSVAEAQRLERLGLPVLPEDGAAYLATRRNDGRGGDRVCAALGGVVGGFCRCTVYVDRPAACVRFEVGSKGCRAARTLAALA
jgi:Fe-S-cluster containining protein